MSKRRIFAAAIAVVLALGAGTSASAATRTITIRVEGMTCGGCAVSIEQALKKVDGVKEARVSYERGEAWVRYDDRKVTAARLREVIKAEGYEVVTRPAARRSKRSHGGVQKPASCCAAISCDT